MPPRKKRKWVSFVRKVKSVEASGRGTQQAIINDGFVSSWRADPLDPAQDNPLQGISEVNLYSVNGVLSGDQLDGRYVGNRDKDIMLNDIKQYQETISTTTGMETRPLNFNESTRTRVPMTSAHVDITYTNLSDVILEVDLYTIVHKKLNPDVIKAGVYPVDLLDAQDQYNIQSNTQPLTYTSTTTTFKGGSGPPSLAYRGITPFQTWGLMKFAGAKVLTKTKVLIGSGQSITRKYADNRHKMLYAHSTDAHCRYDKDTITYLAIPKHTNSAGSTIK